MVKEINLLPKKNKGILDKESTIVVVRIMSIISFIFVLSSFVGIFFLTKNYSLAAIQNEQDAVQAKFAVLNPKTTKILALSDRIQHIKSILQKKVDLTEKITAIQQKIPSDVKLETLNVTSKTISLTATSASLISLQNFINALTNMVSQKKLLQQLTIDNVSVDIKSGLYTVNVKGSFL